MARALNIDSSQPSPQPGFIAALVRFFGSWRFAAIGLGLLGTLELLLAGMLFVPAGEAGLGAFAEEFRVWCFGLDPATGSVEFGYVLTMLTSPVMMSLVLVGVWGAELGRARRRGERLSRPVLAGGGLALLSVAGLGLLGSTPDRGDLPFPAASLRTAIPMAEIDLIDHERRPFRLSDQRGRVVLLTAIYSSCGNTCPHILNGAKDAIAALSAAERADLVVAAVTLDPATDTPEQLAGTLEARELDPEVFRLLTGEPARVEATLDRMGIRRTRDPVSGVIDHANLFLLVDREQRLAYTLTLGERQERWLVAALHELLAEVDP